MNIYGFQIKLNEKVLCRAGFENAYSVVSCILGSVRRESDTEEEVYLTIGGLNSETNQSVRWFNEELKHGDKISIEVIDPPFDLPAQIDEQDPETFLLEQKIKYFHRLKEELKDHLK